MLSMSVGRDYRSGRAYEYVIFEDEQIVARQGFFRTWAQAKRAGLKCGQNIEESRAAVIARQQLWAEAHEKGAK